MIAGDSFLAVFLSTLAGQAPVLLVELGFAIAVLVMLLVQGPKLGRARGVALAGAGLLVALAVVTRVVFAGMQAWIIEGGIAPATVGLAYTAVGIVFQALHGVAIVLLALAVIRRRD
ncbi:hypothetical protein [Luteimonas kalidii]|uniref:Transmembrane protein n=1 Tax=Luteimonas kalidii TaxID=3042025 RepID=A0ABT6JRE9_9GAMM|nr:hypothetical protein [Luteimonas kalidii]MDH5833259.1 hypothetical protein [Luteimonas kalidii]